MSNDKNSTFSWSRLNSYHQGLVGEGCLHCFDLQYNGGDRGEGNFFSEYGSLIHETIEKIHNEELLVWDIESELRMGLNSLKFKAPFKHMGKSYEAAAYKFFEDFDETFKKYKILEAEEKKVFQIDDIWMVGYPDMVAEHSDYGLVIGDYKTAKTYVGDKLEHNIMQLYIYAIPIYEKYGRYPDHLVYFYSREKEQIEYVYKFDLNKLEQTKQFVTDTAKKMENHQGEYKPRCKEVDGSVDFYACNLCNHRRNCEFRYTYKSSNPLEDAI